MYKKILAAVNEYSNSEIAARYALALAKACHAKLTLLYVSKDPVDKDAIKKAEAAIERLFIEAQQGGIEVESLILKGDPVKKIIEHAVDQGTDIVFAASNATFEIARDLGWDYFVKLAAQNVMQVQSATDTPKRISLGERAVMVDGAGYLVIRYKEAGQPVDIIYPEEGTPLAAGPSAVFKAAPNPNAARLFQNWMHSREAQQLLVDYARQYSPHGQTVEKPGVRKLADIKLMKEDPEGVYAQADAVKKRYAEIFKV